VTASSSAIDAPCPALDEVALDCIAERDDAAATPPWDTVQVIDPVATQFAGVVGDDLGDR